MQRRLTSQDISWFLDLDGLKRLDLEPSYQRRSVWTRRDRQFFLDTIFNNYPSPAIFLHKDLDDYGNATYHVVDGKQRLETILLFVADKIPLSERFGDTRINGKRWKDLKNEADLRKTFLDYQITVEMLDSIETAVVNEIFGRLNQNSRKLTPQEIRHARYDGWFINRAEQEAESPFWKTVKISTAGRAKRMQNIQFISELMAATIEGRPLGFDQEELDKFYADFEFPEDLEPPYSTEDFNEKFGKVKLFLQELEDSNGCLTTYATNLAHLYTLWTWVASQTAILNAEETALRYSTFMQFVADANRQGDDFSLDEMSLSLDLRQAVLSYVANSKGATTDLAPRNARHLALATGLASLDKS